MKQLLIFLSIVGALTTNAQHKRHWPVCRGKASCIACKNCKYCKNCNKYGGTCGVCKRTPRKVLTERDPELYNNAKPSI